MATGKFDGEGFYSAIDAARIARNLTWKKVAEQSGVPASTLTRMSQGRKPDVDSLAALSEWSGVDTRAFMSSSQVGRSLPEPLSQITAHLRADPKLSKEAVRSLEAIIKTVYKQLTEE